MPTDTKAHRVAPMRTLGEVSELLDLPKVMSDPERYLARQIKTGKIRGRKVGRSWMMNDFDIEFAIEAFANTVTPTPEPAAEPEPVVVGMLSAASMRRRRIA